MVFLILDYFPLLLYLPLAVRQCYVFLLNYAHRLLELAVEIFNRRFCNFKSSATIDHRKPVSKINPILYLWRLVFSLEFLSWFHVGGMIYILCLWRRCIFSEGVLEASGRRVFLDCLLLQILLDNGLDDLVLVSLQLVTHCG